MFSENSFQDDIPFTDPLSMAAELSPYDEKVIDESASNDARPSSSVFGNAHRLPIMIRIFSACQLYVGSFSLMIKVVFTQNTIRFFVRKVT